MKKTIFLFLPIAILLFATCKKKTTAPAQNLIRVGNVYDDSSHLSTLYYYSPTQLISGDYDDSDRYSYVYQYGNAQNVMQVELNGSPAYSVYYIWNSQSLVDSSNILSTSGGVGIRKKYTYDSNNFLTGVTWYNDFNTVVLTETFTVSNGNIVQHTYNVLDTTNSSLPRGSYTYTYYTGQNNTLSNLYYGQPYLGSSSANPVKSSTYTYGSTSTTVDYTYHYNNGYISSQLIYADSAGISTTRIDSISYNYYFYL